MAFHLCRAVAHETQLLVSGSPRSYSDDRSWLRYWNLFAPQTAVLTMQCLESLQVPLSCRPRGQLAAPATASQNAVRALAVGNAIEAKRSLHAVTHGLLDELSDKSGLYLAGGVVLGDLLDKTCSDIDVFLVRLTEEEAWAR